VGLGDVAVQPVRRADPLLVQCLDRGACCPPDHLAGERADHGGVVAVALPWFPEGLLPDQQFGQHPVIGDLWHRHRAVEADQARAVGKQIAHAEIFLARAGEIGPVVRDPPVEVDHAVLHQQREHQVRRPLGDGVQAGQLLGGEIVARREIHDETAAKVGGQLRARLVMRLLGKHRSELLAHALESGRHSPVHFQLRGHAVPYSRVVRLRTVCASCNRRPGAGYSVPANRHGALTLRSSEAHPRRPRRRACDPDASHGG
jgi:hypothetical protein